MIHIYGYPYTRSSRAVWALEETGMEYGYTPVNLAKGEHKLPEFLKLNPCGKLPVLKDGELVLAETAAICTYIGEKSPASMLVPTQTADRAHYFQWCFFTMTELDAPLWMMTKHTQLLPQERRVPAVAETCIWEFQRAANVLAQHLEGREYAVGSHFTAADILLGSTLNWARKAGVGLESAVLEAYAERMAVRPGLVRAREREAKAVA